MTLLSESVSVLRRFRKSIRIDVDTAADCAEGFICTATAAQALRVTIDHVSEHGHGAFTWTGPYGCGKSSLAVVLAAALGPDGKARRNALAVLPEDVRDRIAGPMRWQRSGWNVIPVSGRRADACEVISAAMDDRGAPPGKNVIDRLTAFSKKGVGTIVFVDEMGKLLEHAASADGDAFLFQELAEAASRSGGRLVVIGILHQAFDDYAYRLARETRDDWLKIQGRFVDVALSPAADEQLNLLASAIDAPARPAKLLPAIQTAEQVRSGQSDADAVAETLRRCWPISPVVACLLGPLSRRRFGQNQRSLFGFLGSAEPGGFQDFLRSTDAEAASLYDTSWLWNYLRQNLEPSILASPDGHRWSLAIDAVERCESRGADEGELRVAIAIALIDMFRERSGLVASPDALRAALPDLSAVEIERHLGTLVSWSVVVHRRHLGGYSLYAGSDFDIESAIRDASSDIFGCDYGRLRGAGMFAPILAKRHYHLTGAMRWFEVDVVSLDEAQDRVDRFKGDAGAVGLFLLLINEGGASKASVRRLIKNVRARIGDRPIAIGVAEDSFMLREISMELLALERIQATRPELKGDVVARREVASRIARLGAELEERLRSSLAITSWHLPEVYETDVNLEGYEGAARLSLLASALAGSLFPLAPRIANELVNRAKPSSNAMAAVRALMIAMVGAADKPLLDIEGFPPERGLYASILEKTGIHRRDGSNFGFVTPPDVEHGLRPVWEKADELLVEQGADGANLDVVFDVWRARPYGIKDGLLPILGLAYILSRQDQVSIYLDGTFCASLSDLFVDRMLQDAAAIRVRRIDISDHHSLILHGISQVTAALLGEDVPLSADPLAVGRQLVALVMRAPAWVRRTQRLSPTAARVRDLAAAAHDPNKFMLDDLPRIFENEGDIDAVVAQMRVGLAEIANAYSEMIRELREGLLAELAAQSDEDGTRLRERAMQVVGLTGNYRLDAFATRLRDDDGSIESIEGLASLAANKPPRDWVDRDVDAARIELAALAQDFLRAEGLAHVKGRPNGRTRMALYISDPGRPALAVPEFTVDEVGRQRARALAAKLREVIDSRHLPEVVLTALIELSGDYAKLTGADDLESPPKKVTGA